MGFAIPLIPAIIAEISGAAAIIAGLIAHNSIEKSFKDANKALDQGAGGLGAQKPTATGECPPGIGDIGGPPLDQPPVKTPPAEAPPADSPPAETPSEEDPDPKEPNSEPGDEETEDGKHGALHEAVEAEKRRRAEEAKKRGKDGFGTHTPKEDEERTRGYWDGKRGNSGWHSTNPKVLAITGGKPIQFTNGHADFSPYARETVDIGRFTTAPADVRAANKAMGYDKTPKGWSWHHKDDLRTMELVPTDLHGNVPHEGGQSLNKRIPEHIKRWRNH